MILISFQLKILYLSFHNILWNNATYITIIVRWLSSNLKSLEITFIFEFDKKLINENKVHFIEDFKLII